MKASTSEVRILKMKVALIQSEHLELLNKVSSQECKNFQIISFSYWYNKNGFEPGLASGSVALGRKYKNKK